MTPPRAVILAALLAAILSIAGAAPASVSAGQLGRIDHVADGDTVDLTNGAKIRLVQIDTPEVYFSPECYGKKACRQSRSPCSRRGLSSDSPANPRPTPSIVTVACSAT
jgi:endonuclease YncB( thermonuclease family)